MLDTETKRRIDTARDILVGKVPDPKSQVEQITIALIYKFMDDMDKESVSMGGKASFFTGNYAKYSWTNIFSPKISGFDMITLYGEAIEKLNINPKIPQLFRDIFKNAYLPYRDPETLKLFLKTINEFTYDHSEKLGDAFEYLLSVLGTQGDAGQFRTPRHIIDFIVQCVEPKKNETICDPACGTAGFIISAYKYIMQQNTVKSRGDKLTPDDRKKMSNNFVGYDIDPNMVRLALANMYLHGFAAPHIMEYDTLTSEERWNENYDVILANPPFMSPKGGIKPHKRFSVQANRSEVLFVDYIAEHINPTTGRAGVIVPEGIIFQSAGAYKQLRKMLVDKKYLYAVVSLPAGIFQPYSGVKTSILLMDRALARKTDNILFIKVENDGFDLGAQRRANDKSELAGALEIIKEYKQHCLNRDSSDLTDFIDYLKSKTGDQSSAQSRLISGQSKVQTVDRKAIAANGDYNLSIDRYRVNENVQQSHFEMVSLADVCEFIGGYAFKSDELLDLQIENSMPVVKIGNLDKQGYIDLTDAQYYTLDGSLKKYLIKKGDVLIAMTGATVGKVAVSGLDNIYLNQRVGLIRARQDLLEQNFLKANLLNEKFYDYCQMTAGGGAQGNISPTNILNFEIPLPPLSIQQQIVSKIESYQKIIDGAKQITENYKPQIDIDAGWEMVKLGEVTSFVQGINTAIDKLNYVEDGIKVLQANNIYLGNVNFDNLKYITEKEFSLINIKYKPTKEDVLYSNIGARFGYASTIDFDDAFTYSWNVLRLIINERKQLDKLYLKNILNTEIIRNVIVSKSSTSTMPFISGKELKQIEIPLPPLSTQQSIVHRIEQEQQLVNGNKELIKIFEQKIKDEIGKLWEGEKMSEPLIAAD